MELCDYLAPPTLKSPSTPPEESKFLPQLQQSQKTDISDRVVIETGSQQQICRPEPPADSEVPIMTSRIVTTRTQRPDNIQQHVRSANRLHTPYGLHLSYQDCLKLNLVTECSSFFHSSIDEMCDCI